jgi:two-component system response regulator CpxR
MNTADQHTALSVLLIDDDVELCKMMAEYFGQLGHHLQYAHDGRDGLEAALRVDFDVLLLDVMLPLVNGFSVLQQLRRRKDVPVVMLTARSHRDDRIAGLNKGADDYIVKPFDPDEVLARIRAVLRRVRALRNDPKPVRRLEGFEIDSNRREVRLGEKVIELTALEFDIFEMLVGSAGRIVSREEITETLFDRAATPYDRALDVHVSHLRSKLDRGRNLIRTIRGVGYMLTATPE